MWLSSHYLRTCNCRRAEKLESRRDVITLHGVATAAATETVYGATCWKAISSGGLHWVVLWILKRVKKFFDKQLSVWFQSWKWKIFQSTHSAVENVWTKMRRNVRRHNDNITVRLPKQNSSFTLNGVSPRGSEKGFILRSQSILVLILYIHRAIYGTTALEF